MIKRSLEPDYEAVISRIRSMSDDDLKDLINNDDKVDELVKLCEQCKDLETEKDMIMAKNKSLAEYNLSKSPELESGKAKLKEICESVQTVRDSVEEKQSELKNHSGNLNSDTVLALLQAAAAESEEESEKIAEKFYQKEIEIEDFLEQFHKRPPRCRLSTPTCRTQPQGPYLTRLHRFHTRSEPSTCLTSQLRNEMVNKNLSLST
ncbi:UNVERIFIED_CONTAM: hypothetical protein PYX00_009601 [Menopon gallinae]|uniref:VPS37 C-terminal domain-containing protein n=1 Tax=Menopon gallinae TaxID=328185 RepID=A0AAW2HBY3_9NEOP